MLIDEQSIGAQREMILLPNYALNHAEQYGQITLSCVQCYEAYGYAVIDMVLLELGVMNVDVYRCPQNSI